jgi:type III secretory pathway component EscV
MAMWIKTVAIAGWVILMVSIAGGVVAMHAYY